MTTISSAGAGWKLLLESTTAFNRDAADRVDMRPWWRVQAWRRHAGEPEPIVRAQAFATVLDNAPLHVEPGAGLVGSKASFLLPELPDYISQAEYAAALDEHKARGQRIFCAGWDHTLADYPTILAEGIGGITSRAEKRLSEEADGKKRITLEAMILSLRALTRFIRRYAAECRATGRADLAETLERVAAGRPQTMLEAVQLVWMVETAFVSERRYANALGRLDQYLMPFYQADLHAGRLTRDGALDILCHLWARIEELGEVTNICIGGVTSDGRDATNELSYLCLEATRLVLTPHANLSARLHDATSEEFHRACFECIRTGVGFPAIFNDHVLVEGLVELGIPLETARDHCMVGCIETMLPGKQPAWSDSRFNAPLQLLEALRDLGATAATERTYERLIELFRQRTEAAVKAHAEMIDAEARKYPVERFPDPFLSALTQDCIGRGLDINDGGALYPRMHGIVVMGLATVADSLAALKKLVFDERQVELEELMKALEADFKGYEPLRQTLERKAPKYGNDDSYVDEIAAWFVEFVSLECMKHRLSDGGWFVSAMAANVQNISAGREVAATPDGRRAKSPLSDAASPHFGRDLNGPTAFLHSVSRPDYRRVLTGSVVNMKFEPEFFRGRAGSDRFLALTKFFVRSRIQELQFNFTGNATLAAAQANPQEYANLVVRVSGFSAYFTRLEREVQDDILRRRAHG